MFDQALNTMTCCYCLESVYINVEIR